MSRVTPYLQFLITNCLICFWFPTNKQTIRGNHRIFTGREQSWIFLKHHNFPYFFLNLLITFIISLPFFFYQNATFPNTQSFKFIDTLVIFGKQTWMELLSWTSPYYIVKIIRIEGYEVQHNQEKKLEGWDPFLIFYAEVEISVVR